MVWMLSAGDVLGKDQCQTTGEMKEKLIARGETIMKFKNKGQKPGKKGTVGKEKEMKTAPVDAKLRKISKAMFGRMKATENDALQRAQLNG